MLVQPVRATTASMASAADAAGGALLSRRRRACGDIAGRRLAAPDPSAAAVARRRLRFGLLGVRVGIMLDPYHRQDDDRRGLCRVTAEAHDAPLIRKFDNVAHQPLSSPAAVRALCTH